jgi:hypothetical protein
LESAEIVANGALSRASRWRETIALSWWWKRHKIRDFQNSDVPEPRQARQVIVAGHDEFRLSRDSTLKYSIVINVVRDDVQGFGWMRMDAALIQLGKRGDDLILRPRELKMH